MTDRKLKPHLHNAAREMIRHFRGQGMPRCKYEEVVQLPGFVQAVKGNLSNERWAAKLERMLAAAEDKGS